MRVLSELASSRSFRIVLVLVAMWIALGLHPMTREAFLTTGNFSNLTAQVAEIVVIGVGMTFVVLVGGIDLSVGSGIALTGVVTAKLIIDHHQPVWVAVLAAVVLSGLVGAWHGLLVTRLSIPPFIATLSGLLAYRGVAIVLADARGLAFAHGELDALAAPLPAAASFGLAAFGLAAGVLFVVRRAARRRHLGLPAPSGAELSVRIGLIAVFAGAFALVYRGGIPVPVVVAAASAALGALVLRKTRLGRYAFAIGGNAEAARLSGVPVARVTTAIYVATGVLTALAGVIVAARSNGVTPANAGLTRELHIVTAVVIGGTSLSGGRGTIIGTVVGALVIGTLSNGMNHMTINSNWQTIVTGAILLGAALLDALSSKKDLSPRVRRVATSGLVAAAAAAAVAVFARGSHAATPAAEEGPRVAFLLSTLQEERYQKDQRYFEEEARRLGLSAFTLAADNDNGRQLAELEDALTRGAKVVVVQPTDSVAAASYVEKAHAKGAKLVAYDRAIRGAGLDAYVAHDSFAVGKLIAEAAVRHTGGKGRYVLCNGQAGHSVANEIARGMHAVLDPLVARGDIVILVEQTHDAWSPEQSLKTVEDAIAKSKGDIQAVLAHNSGMARGAVQAIAAAGLGDEGIFVGGADADAANVNWVCEGKQSIEVLKDIRPLAEKAAQVAALLAKNEPVDGERTPAVDAPTLAVPVLLVTRDNATHLLVDSGFHARTSVPSCP